MEHRERKSPRLKDFDYRTPGAYFVTICSFERACTFDDAEIRDTIEWQWRVLGTYRRHVPPGEFVVMPNHVHGIVWITRDPIVVGTQHAGMRDGHTEIASYSNSVCLPGRLRAASLHGSDAYTGPACESLSAIIRGFKSACAKRVNRIRRTPGAVVWQDRFHERVIRDDRHLLAAQQYILDNPRKWFEDPNHPQNLKAA